MRAISLLILVLIAPAACAADIIDGRPFDPSSGRDTRNYPPDPQVDFQHIKLDLRMPDPFSRSFTCTETITFRTPQRTIKSLKLDAVELDISSVTDLAGNKLDSTTDD